MCRLIWLTIRRLIDTQIGTHTQVEFQLTTRKSPGWQFIDCQVTDSQISGPRFKITPN